MNERHPADTRTVTILPEKRTIAATPGDNLLAILADHGILLRSDCGGKGVCGKCLVELVGDGGPALAAPACSCTVTEDMAIVIPPGSLVPPHIVDKAEIFLPSSFQQAALAAEDSLGIAVDLGSTTIAVYLVDRAARRVLSSLAVKNPQSLHGDDVMSRIGYVGDQAERLARLQRLTCGAILWAVDALTARAAPRRLLPAAMVIVGNPTMIHILLGVSPASIGISPYEPQFFSARNSDAATLGLGAVAATVRTLPQISGFIGGDILAAAIATELTGQPPGTLLIDLGTNGELLLKGEDGFYATSCATGPAFEGAAISCGMQAMPGAIERIAIDARQRPSPSTIAPGSGTAVAPQGICGSGIVSGIAAMLARGVINHSGALARILPEGLEGQRDGVRTYRIHREASGEEIAISQKDVRQVQLGKAALISGIDFLLARAGIAKPTRVLVAGAFGSHLDKRDLLTLGMLPPLPPEDIVMVGNAAGSGAVMVLCDPGYVKQAEELAARTTVINLAADPLFQEHFITRLSFP